MRSDTDDEILYLCFFRMLSIGIFLRASSVDDGYSTRYPQLYYYITFPGGLALKSSTIFFRSRDSSVNLFNCRTLTFCFSAASSFFLS